MSTPPPPTPPSPTPGGDDDRDPRVAAWLAVEPLDDVTRARLVRTALDTVDAEPDEEVTAPALAPASRRRPPFAALVSIAAAVLALLVVAGAVLLPRDDASTPTAESAPATASVPERSREADDSGALAPSPAAEDALTLGALPSIGDLGDVSDSDRLARAARAALALPAGTATTTVTGCAAAAGRAFGTPVAVGTGSIDGRPATVVVAEQASGGTAVVAVRGRSCARGVSVVLP